MQLYICNSHHSHFLIHFIQNKKVGDEILDLLNVPSHKVRIEDLKRSCPKSVLWGRSGNPAGFDILIGNSVKHPTLWQSQQSAIWIFYRSKLNFSQPCLTLKFLPQLTLLPDPSSRVEVGVYVDKCIRYLIHLALWGS